MLSQKERKEICEAIMKVVRNGFALQDSDFPPTEEQALKLVSLELNNVSVLVRKAIWLHYPAWGVRK